MAPLMEWSSLATQFSLELAFGLLFALAFVPKAPVGAFFYRLMGTSALVPILIAAGAPLMTGARAWSDPVILCAGVAVLAYPFFSGPVRGARWGIALGLGLLGTAAAAALVLAEAAPPGALRLALATATALCTGAVVGSVALAMVLGHWYLTVPNLAIAHLARLNRVTVGCMLASLVLLGVSCLVFDDVLSLPEPPLFGPTGLFYLGTRVAVGLLLPLCFAWMTASSLRFQNTRSATGILYASTVLVLIGTAVSVSLQGSYGVPL